MVRDELNFIVESADQIAERLSQRARRGIVRAPRTESLQRNRHPQPTSRPPGLNQQIAICQPFLRARKRKAQTFLARGKRIAAGPAETELRPDACAIFLSPRFLLPLMVLLGVLILGLRVDDVWDAASSGNYFAPRRMAETTPPTASTCSRRHRAPRARPTDRKACRHRSKRPPRGADAVADIAIPDDASPAEMEVLKQLSDRREELDKRAQISIRART